MRPNTQSPRWPSTRQHLAWRLPCSGIPRSKLLLVLRLGTVSRQPDHIHAHSRFRAAVENGEVTLHGADNHISREHLPPCDAVDDEEAFPRNLSPSDKVYVEEVRVFLSTTARAQVKRCTSALHPVSNTIIWPHRGHRSRTEPHYI